MQEYFWILEDKEKVYFVSNKKIGTEYDMIKYLILRERISSSKAHKTIKKIKEKKRLNDN
jgi:hypothetical protein